MRNQVLKLLWQEILHLSEGLQQSKAIAHRLALAQEAVAYSRSAKATYKNVSAQTLSKLKKRAVFEKPEDAMTNEDFELAELKQREENQARLPASAIRHLVIGHDLASSIDGYVLQVPEGEGATEPTATGTIQTCRRCKVQYSVKNDLTHVSFLGDLPRSIQTRKI